MFWVPPSIVLLLFSARLVELRHRFAAVPGRVLHRWTFNALTLAGSLTVIAALGEYFVAGRRPSPPCIVVGLLLAVAAFTVRAAARRALGRMWSVHVEIRDQHTLVQDGPYRFVRHPIYLAMLLEVAAAVVVPGSWISGGIGLALTVIAISLRVRAEETAMAQHLGAAWDEYRRRTPAFLPLW